MAMARWPWLPRLSRLLVLSSALLLALSSADDNDLFSSTFEMRRLYLTELQFTADVFQYADMAEKHAEAVRRAVNAMYPDGPPKASSSASSPEELSKQAEAYVANPLNALGVIRRLASDIHQSGLAESLSAMFVSLETHRQKIANMSAIFPSMKDYEDATSSVSLLQETYGLDLGVLADGVVRFEGKSYPSDHVPTWRELTNLAATACNRGLFDTGLTLYDLALKKVPDDDRNSEEWVKTTKNVDTARQIHDQLLDKKGMYGVKHRCFPLPFDEKLRKKKKFKAARKGKVPVDVAPRISPLFKPHNVLPDMAHNFKLLCKGDSSALRSANISRPADMDSAMKCLYLDHGNPYLRLGPFKMEELNSEPSVALFHDFFSSDECDHLMTQVSDKLFRSGVGSAASSTTNLMRTSKQAWIRESLYAFDYLSGRPLNLTKEPSSVESDEGEMTQETNQYSPDSSKPPRDYLELIPLVPARPRAHLRVLDRLAFGLSLRIEKATGLSVTGTFSSEMYQVANYGLGGQYSTHMDPHGFHDGTLSFSGPFDRAHYATTGDRAATFMGYLTDVELGGATVFPLLGVTSPVKRGSAIFWLNLFSDGTSDHLTHHGGCPVLVGSKWITNKWIQYHDQFHGLPCGLSRRKHSPLLNRWRNSGQ